MDIDEFRTEHFHVTIRWRLGPEPHDPTAEDIHAVLAEGLQERLGIRDPMEVNVAHVHGTD